MDTAGPKKIVRQPASSAKRKKFDTPATWTHSPSAPAITVFVIIYSSRSSDSLVENDKQEFQDVGFREQEFLHRILSKFL
jgi:hypothetical protein